MAEWKKVIVSGSQAGLAAVSASIGLLVGSNQQITTNSSTTFLSGSFSGSFAGNGSNLTGVSASIVLNSASAGEGISPFSFNGSSNVTVSVSGAAQLSNNAVTKWNDADGKFVNSSLTDNGTTITGATSIQLTGANSILTGSFSGSFVGTTNLPDLTQGVGITAFTYDGATTANVAVSGAASLSTNRVTKWTGTAFADTSISDSGTLVTVTNNALFQGNITVQGTASFQNAESLLIADRFALFASGSTTTGDGGIVVQQGTQNVGELFGYDNGTTRWGFTSSFNAASSTFTPSVYVGAVQVGTGQTAASTAPIYGGAVNGFGTIHVDTDDGEIWIYA
jgi:hypothetical protein